MPSTPPDNPFPPDYYEKFMQELAAIREQIKASGQLVPDAIAASQKQLANTLKQFYEQGFSNVASRSADQQPAPRLGPSAGASGVSADEIAQALRQRLGSQGAGVTGHRIRDEREQESGGYRTSAAAGQRPLRDQMRNWEELVTPSHMQRGYLEMPRSQGGHFTASDLFNYVSDSLLSRAGKRSADLTKEFDDLDVTTPEGYARGERITQQVDALDRPWGSGGAGAFLQRAGHEYIPQLAIARQYLARVGFNASPGGLEATGTQLGVSPGSGFGSSLTIPGTDIGFRVPFLNPAARAGLTREFDIQKSRFAAGINGQQARAIFDMLNETGYRPQANQHGDHQYWMSGRPNFGDMKDALVKITKQHPELLNEQTMQLMDKSVRSGAATLGDFVKTINAVPDAAKAAGISFQQLQADMDAAGNAAEQMGGTNFQGQRAAVQFAGLTKQPSALLAPLMSNPLVQTMGVQKYGLMPWEQGAMNGYEWASTITGSLGQTFNALGPMPGKNINIGNGFVDHISGRTRKEQLMSQMYGIAPDKIDQFLREQKTVQARGKLGAAAEAWSAAVGQARGNPAEIQRLFGHGAGHYGALTHLMNLGGFNDKDQAAVYNVDKNLLHKKLSGKDAQKLATDRYNKIQDIIRKKGNLLGTDPNQNVLGVIKLDDKARKKGFYLDNKRSAQGGVLPVNAPYGSTPTPEPGSPFDMPTGPTYGQLSGGG